MIRSIKHLRGNDIAAKDGALGDVHDIFFDDHSWKTRYVAIDTGNWLPGRRVLISPQSVLRITEDDKVAVGLTKDEIANSPSIHTNEPVSRQNEIALADHFTWPRYWEEYPSGAGMMPVIPHLQHQPAGSAPQALDDDVIPHGDPNLRSASEVEGYHVAARDGDIGHVEDLLLDDSNWTLRYVVVDTRNWWPGKKVLVAPAWTRGIDWADQKLLVDADRDTIKEAPEYESGMTFDQALERRIYQHYGKQPYGE
ncbi:MAG: PRC-barrel domain-containing protein [Kiloniellaceae bacterium]